MTKKCSG